MHADLKYVESLEKEIDELENDKAEFSNMYDILFQECVFNDVMCSYLHSLSDLDAHSELQCLYLHKVKECECLAQKLSKQTESVSKEVYTELLQSFAKLEKHSISLELALQQCQEQIKNDTVCKEKASNKLIEKLKGKSVDTNFEKQSILGKPPLQPIRNQPVVGLKWILIRKPVEYRYNMNDSASPLGKETHNPKTVICANSSSLSAVRARVSSAFKTCWSRHKIARWQRRSRLKDEDLKISDVKMNSKDNDNGSRSKITKHEGTSVQQR
nr:hypothetical protein [Tanacetum cinerariifolium]